MATVIVSIKLMPDSPEANLEAIKKSAQSLMENEGAKGTIFEEKPIAFGLKAIFMKFAIDEAKGTDMIESKLSSIESISSVTIEDYRRAMG